MSAQKKYQKPDVTTPQQFKEAADWKTATPADSTLRGKWWELYGDTQLNVLEEKIAVSNQTLKSAAAQFDQARAQLRISRSALFPTITVQPSVSRARVSGNRPLGGGVASQNGDFVLPVDATYEADLWGRVRNTVTASRQTAQATAADLENVSLVLHAELASDYFSLRGLDNERQLLDDTVKAYEKALELTENRFHGGVSSESDVAFARTQLETARAQAIDVQVARAQFEHAIGTLIGEPASSFSLAPVAWSPAPPPVPLTMPSQLLERRPDIAASERRVAAANAQIGVAHAAYFPTLTLGASGGFESTSITTLLQGTSGLWSLGAGLIETAFEVGKRRGINEQAKAAYVQTVADYRQSALNAFEEVEDNLSALRLLEDEAKAQQKAVEASDHLLAISNNRYKGGVAAYIEVINAQNAALADQRTAVGILVRRMTASVGLIKALGGGWDASQLPQLTKM
jgi:NodT family efflux transporter outer membrane factor (OMF) lipoprotein